MAPPLSRPRTVHITTVHPRGDARIFWKEMLSIAQALHRSVILVVADGKGDETYEQDSISVLIHDVGKPRGGRVGRATLGAWRVFSKAREMRPDVVHFHDPELIPAGILLKVLGHRVIYDAHEDVPRQMLIKHWLPRILQQPVAWTMSAVEWIAAKVVDAIVTATPKIGERFPSHKTVVVQNFPIRSEFMAREASPYKQRRRAFAYVGGVSPLRGAWEMIRSIEKLGHAHGVQLEIAGNFSPSTLEAELQCVPGWRFVDFHGYLSRSEVARLLNNVRAGLVVLHPALNYRDAYPVKMFEYMAAALPVIASDFPLWRKIIQDARCGLLVNPLDPQDIAAAMLWILENPDEAQKMGQRGKEAVELVYNWERESNKLVALYKRLLGEIEPARL